MPHPFFDAMTFPWVRQDAQALHTALYQAPALSAQLVHVYQVVGGTQPLTPGLAAHLAWREVLDLLTGARRLRALCDHLLATPAYAALHPAVQAVVDARDPIRVQGLVRRSQVFIDRAALRTQLEGLIDPFSESPVLLVRGPSGSGKSWTQHLVIETGRAFGAECVFLFPGVVSSVEDVVEALFAAIGAGASVPPRLETDDAWFRKVCLKLQEQALARKVVMWVIVDDLGDYPEGPRLDTNIRRFFDQFVLMMGNPAFARHFRLVLLDYPEGDVPTRWQSVWAEDRLSDRDVDEAPLKEFLLGWAKGADKRLAEDRAAEIAAAILARADEPVPAGAPPPPPRLKRIHAEVKRVLATL